MMTVLDTIRWTSGIRPIAASRLACALLSLLLPVSASASGKIIEEGIIRKTSEVLADSDLIYKVTGDEIRSGRCGGNVDLHVARVVESFRGPAKAGEVLEFCGYAQLIPSGDNVLGLNHGRRDGMPRFMPDAVYSERQPGQYFRLLSYESHVYEIDGKSALVSGFDEPGFSRVLMVLKAEHPRERQP